MFSSYSSEVVIVRLLSVHVWRSFTVRCLSLFTCTTVGLLEGVNLNLRMTGPNRAVTVKTPFHCDMNFWFCPGFVCGK